LEEDDIEISAELEMLETVVQDGEVESGVPGFPAGKEAAAAHENARPGESAGDHGRFIAGFAPAAAKGRPVRENAAFFLPKAFVAAGDDRRLEPPGLGPSDDFHDDRGFTRPAEGDVADADDGEGGGAGLPPTEPEEAGFEGAGRPPSQGQGSEKKAHFS
jgi:hypothetical protein